ncbi:DUF262 domain-containing protein [Desulfobacter latus]|nr:DUF262 domain-containing protein [Desulfobacter latus]
MMKNDKAMKQPSLELESEAGLSACFEDVYPDATVKISRDQYSVFEIRRMIRDTGELILDPEFQRKRVWKLEQERELIESVLMGIPIPVFYVFEDMEGKKQIVDGRQRISAIVRYLDNEFFLDNLKMLPQFDKKKFNELAPLYQSKIERYQVSVYVIEPPTPERVKYDIFDRVNRGGTRLNSQEMRHALYSGASTRLLKKLSKFTAFKKATGNGVKGVRMRDQYIILRFLGFHLWRQQELEFQYKSKPDELLAMVMQTINSFSSERIEALEKMFNVAMSRSFEVLGPDGFRFQTYNVNKRPINMALFEAMAHFFALVNLDGLDKAALKKDLDELKIVFDNSDFFKGRVDSTTSVEYRFKAVEALAGRKET